MAASRKFLFEHPDDARWNESGGGATGGNMFDDDAGWDEGGSAATAVDSWKSARSHMARVESLIVRAVDTPAAAPSVASSEERIECVDWLGNAVGTAVSARPPAVAAAPQSQRRPEVEEASSNALLRSAGHAALGIGSNARYAPARRPASPAGSSQGADVPRAVTPPKPAGGGLQRQLSSKSGGAGDFERLRKEFANLQREYERVSNRRHRRPSAREAVDRLVIGETGPLEPFRSLKHKAELLDEAIQCADGDAIAAVITFLERTLTPQLFRATIAARPVATRHHVWQLRRCGRADDLATFYAASNCAADGAAAEFERACGRADAGARVRSLHKCLQSASADDRLRSGAQLVHEYAALLERQVKIDALDASLRAKGRGPYKLAQSGSEDGVVGRNLLDTLYHCCVYHYDDGADSPANPQSLRTAHHLSARQYCATAVRALAANGRWPDVDKVVWRERTKFVGALVGQKIELIVPAAQLLPVLHERSAPADLMAKYLKTVSDAKTRLSLSRQYNVAEVVVDCLVATKDRRALEQYVVALRAGTKEAIYGQNALASMAR